MSVMTHEALGYGRMQTEIEMASAKTKAIEALVDDDYELAVELFTTVCSQIR